MRFTLALLCATTLWPAGFEAGIARVKITPPLPIPLDGYAGRASAAIAVEHDLWAKAVALRDPSGQRVVIIGADLITLPTALGNEVASRVQRHYGIDRAHLLLNCSHTHSGPVILQDSDPPKAADTPENRAIARYTRDLADAFVRVAGAALDDLAPARVEFATGSAAFGANRRQSGPKGIMLGYNPDGPVDHEVPVLRITAPDGRLRGIVFGYACHNTTYGSKNLLVSGDYAGFAQLALERAHPGTTALFLQLCGADQDPYPRLAEGLAQKHGNELARAVEAVLAGKLKRVDRPIRTAFLTVDLPFAPYTRETFERMLGDADKRRAAHASRMLEDMDLGRAVRGIPYPIQVVRFGHALTLLALGGETVVDYSLRAKREFTGEPLIVTGYSNNVRCYVGSRRVIHEGGYEALEAFYYDRLPGPFDEGIEEIIFAGIRKAMAAAGRR